MHGAIKNNSRRCRFEGFLTKSDFLGKFIFVQKPSNLHLLDALKMAPYTRAGPFWSIFRSRRARLFPRGVDYFWSPFSTKSALSAALFDSAAADGNARRNKLILSNDLFFFCQTNCLGWANSLLLCVHLIFSKFAPTIWPDFEIQNPAKWSMQIWKI